MSASISLIKGLLDHIETYENEFGNADLKHFSIYLRDKLISSGPAQHATDLENIDFKDYRSLPEVEFAELFTGLFRFVKYYVKKALTNSNIKTLDEFGFLATLTRNKSLLKNELISMHLMETSSGSEILKRLIKNGLISESPDNNDKRAKRVSLTEYGIIEITQVSRDMHKASELVIGNLDSMEIHHALSIFNKLHYYHQHIHDCNKNATLDELHEKYVDGSGQ